MLSTAKDKLTGTIVAIQKICQPYSTIELARRTYTEMKMLRQLRHDNVISLTDVFISPRDDIYVVSNFQATDLQTLLSLGPIEERFTQYFVYQILRGLKYVHSAGVIHRDLKPSNILVDENCDLKICNFGVACTYRPEMTGYITTRYYRAPETMLFWRRYDYEVDIWSAGCIMGEMLLGKPLFPGVNHVDQFHVIIDTLGTPPDELLQRVTSKNAKQFVLSLPKRERRHLSCILPTVSSDALDLLGRMLVFDPRERIRAGDSLVHPYLAGYHDPADEPIAEQHPDWSFTKSQYELKLWKKMIQREVFDFCPVQQSCADSLFSSPSSFSSSSTTGLPGWGNDISFENDDLFDFIV